jgi:CBS domain-containing protein
VLGAEELVGDALRARVERGLPALPVVDADEACVGIFGERELIRASREVHPHGLYRSSPLRAYAPAIDDGAAFLRDPVGAHADRDRVALAREQADAPTN